MTGRHLLGQRIRYRAKAIVATLGLVVTSAATALVSSPDTARAIETVVPAQLAPLVPVVLVAISAVLVHEVPNGPRPVVGTPASAAAPATAKPTTEDYR